MVYDDIIIGSGLAALGAAIGLAASRKVLVIGGAEKAELEFYSDQKSIPCSYTGVGGLGNFWHGVVPTGIEAPYAQESSKELVELFQYFYPRSSIQDRIGRRWLFVPRRPVRPRREWARLSRQRGGNLRFLPLLADRFDIGDSGPTVFAGAETFKSRRLWIAAGVINSPKIVALSVSPSVRRPFVSDHIICYVGQLEQGTPGVSGPRVERTSEGFWLSFERSLDGSALLTRRPARFDYRRLDYGIEQRAIFGLPTNNAIATLLRATSPGLVAEALFNKFGLFPNSRVLSVYAQILVEDALRVSLEDASMTPVHRSAAQAMARLSLPWPELVKSRRLDLFLRGIHLHHSLDLDAMKTAGLSSDQSTVRVVDASAISQIGPEHHSFYTMARAYRLSRQVTAVGSRLQTLS
ncbi:hypothetical protein XH83_25310 [Bradyrhizobium sp. CCBAU 53351]|uniref:hypothetical protein n=1 Tax=Bradyrhizobium sp. CCBAU 53351 TaxID=1325114 RepID=UPI001886AE18|nr:hypothetical protein [Bradyrhizobium sp. CCBAU 53351]QOZ78445.1 hypothetical protein XH83_25310 [Bradyrhizobium sp. CCBAU 53351]